MKAKLIEAFRTNLIGRIPINYLNVVIEAITVSLEGYEVSQTCTELVLYDGARDEEMFNNFLATKLTFGFSERSIKHYRYVISKFVEAVKLPLCKITSDTITLYLAKKKFHDKTSPVTTVNIKRVLNSFFTYLKKQRYIDDNPVFYVESIKIPKRIKKALSSVELERLRAGAETLRDKAIIDFLFSTGVRVSELVSINRDDINFEKDEIYIIGKGNKERPVYINAESKVSLLTYLNNRRDSNPALFCGLRGFLNKRLHMAGVEIMLRNLGRKLGIDNVHPHRLRRTMATIAVNRGVEMSKVSKLLGHENIATTLIYANTDMEQARFAHRMAVN